MFARSSRAISLAGGLLLAVVVAGSLAIMAQAGAARRHSARPPGTVALFNRVALPYRAPVGVRTEAKRYSFVVLQSIEGGVARRLRAANPHLKVLIYEDALLSRINDPHQFDSCVNYDTAVTQHPAWFIRNAGGARVPDPLYPGTYLMNVGDPGFQQACVNTDIAQAKEGGFDGVYIDDVTAWVGWTVPPGMTVPAYSSPAAWESAMSSFLSYATGQIHAAGLMAVANLGGTTLTPGLWARWSSMVDGSEEQSWTDGGSGPAGEIYFWRTKLANVLWSEAHHKYALLHSYNNSTAGNEYGLASMMLAAGGYSSYSTTNADNASPEKWLGVYVRAERLGAPRGRFRRLSNGVYARFFVHGLVLVNPTAHSVKRFRLGGRYHHGSGAVLRSAALGPTSGLILTAAR